MEILTTKISLLFPLIIVLIGIDLFQHGLATTATRSHYNEFCNKTVKCQPTSWLSCLDGLCQCAKPQSMIYDTKRKKCVVKSGDTCKYSFGNSPADDPLVPVRYEYLDCVENSNCQGIEGICKCISNHYEDGNGTCLPQKMPDTPCDNVPGECRTDLGLTCYEGICDCDPLTTKALYDNTIYFDLHSDPDGREEKRKFCAGLPGQKCMQGKCVPNSSCYMKLNDEGLYNATCACNHGLILSQSEKNCKGNHGAPCMDSSDCHEQFQCFNNKCTCKYNSHQVFDELTNECRSIVYAPCTNDVDCVMNSFCDKSTGSFNSCQCNKGYVEFGPGFCRKGYGQSCDQNERVEPPPNYSLSRKQYIVEENLMTFMTSMERQTFLTLNGHSQSRIVIEDKCDVASRLQCRNGKCDCEDEMELYDEEKKSCVGSVGSLCRPSGGFSSTSICTQNAECGSKSKPELSRCTCIKGYQPTKSRTCVKN